MFGAASMAATVYTTALIRAAEIQGSTQALASLLRVPENTLLRWMAGRAQMPLQAFLKVIEIVSADERRNPPPAGEARGRGGDKLRFRLGQIEARCARCDAVEFVLADASQPLRYISELACASCGERVVHANLIAQLARDAAHHSSATNVARQKRLARTADRPRLRMKDDA